MKSFLKEEDVGSNPSYVAPGSWVLPCAPLHLHRLVNVIIRLLLSFAYCNHSLIVIIRLLLSFAYCYHLLIVIIRLLLSELDCQIKSHKATQIVPLSLVIQHLVEVIFTLQKLIKFLRQK
jgi:tellurite resistance protein TehA-like permease